MKGPFSTVSGTVTGAGAPIAFGVGLVQQRHALKVLLAHLQHDRQQSVHVPVVAHREQRLYERSD